MKRGPLLVLILSAVFAVCFGLYRQGADYPTHFFPDEPGKVEQITDGFRNYRHPALMLEAVSIVSRVAGARPGLERAEDRPIVSRSGRSFSAACAAGSVAALSLLGFVLNGWIGLLAVAIIVGLCPPLLVHAHYFKEDTALVLGFALTALAGHNFVRRCREEGPRRWRYVRPALLLGAAAGIAVSSKYIGAAAVVGAVGLVVLIPDVPRRRRAAAIGACLLASAVVFVTINWRIIGDPVATKAFTESLGFEARHGVTAHRGVTMAMPTTYFVEMTARQVGPWVGLGVVVCLVAVARGHRRGMPIASLVFLLSLGFGFIALLSMCPLADARYALPGTVLLFAAGGIGLAMGSELLGANGCVRCICTAVLICSAGMFQGRACADLTKQFRNDSRYRLVEWAAVNLPREAVVAQDARAGLTRTIGRRGEWIANTEYIRSAMFVPALGALDELRAGGVQYVIIVDAAYGRFLNPRLAPSKHADGTERQSYQKSRSFYTALLAGKDELVWSSGRAATGGMYPLTNPEIRVYRLAPVAGK